jgi:hemerythrin superfamily protein
VNTQLDGEASGIVDVLRRDHRLIAEIAERLEATDEPATARSLLLELIGELAAHEHAEQQVVFPALRDALPATNTETRTRQDEHDEINELLDEMSVLDPTSLAFAKRVGALIFEIRAHFQAEETSLFPKLASALGPEGQRSLAPSFMHARQHAPTFPPSSLTRQRS